MEYINNYTKVKIYCPECNDYFYIKPSSFLDPDRLGCPVCANKKSKLKLRTPQGEWIARAEAKWGDVCDYSRTVYNGSKQKVRIYCKEHKDYFEQLPSTHLNAAYGCPVCSFRHTASESFGEKDIEEVLKSLGIDYTREYQLRGEIFGRNTKIVRIDFKYNLSGEEYWIEYQGEQHYVNISFFGHGDPEWFQKQLSRDQEVREYCENHGIHLLEVPYTYTGKISELTKIISEFNQGLSPEITPPIPGKPR